jgi:hypothetical protein
MQDLPITAFHAEAMHLSVLKTTSKDLMLIIEVVHTCITVLEVAEELSIIQELIVF